MLMMKMLKKGGSFQIRAFQGIFCVRASLSGGREGRIASLLFLLLNGTLMKRGWRGVLLLAGLLCFGHSTLSRLYILSLSLNHLVPFTPFSPPPITSSPGFPSTGFHPDCPKCSLLVYTDTQSHIITTLPQTHYWLHTNPPPLSSIKFISDPEPTLLFYISY